MIIVFDRNPCQTNLENMDRNNNHVLSDKNIPRLLLKLSVPAMIAMFVQATYNVVDAIFVGRGVGSLGIAGITIMMPVHMLVLSIGILIGIGGASIISRALGVGDQEKADRTVGNVFVLVLIFGSIITVAGFVWMDFWLKLFGATPEIMPYARDYAEIRFIGTIFFAFMISSNNIIRSDGRAKVAMGSMLVSALINIILDPIFIFWLDMGVRGAAIATLIAQVSAAIYIFCFLVSGHTSLNIRLKYFFPRWRIIREQLTIGSSAFSRQIGASVMIIIINQTIGKFGDAKTGIYIAAYGIIHRVILMILMPMFGIAQGAQPITGYNYGAHRYLLARKTIKIAILWSSCVSILGFLLLEIFAKTIVSVFTPEQELIQITAKAVRIVAIAMPFIGFQMIGAVMFQAIGKALPSLLLSASRQILFLIPLILILPSFFHISGIWLSFPIADALAVLLTFVFFLNQMRKFKHLETEWNSSHESGN
ncbi:MAG: MATE family efflux transporter [Candidatus Cloacimonetes bacterium]|nr:MATE family efflux transporter [Candidatus Cloacimonadota bacterium]